MNIDLIIKQMTLEEKASLCSGADSWHTKEIKRLNVPAIMVSDGPHGLRKQEEKGDHMGLEQSVDAVCFPSGAAIASSFDVAAISRMGTALGEEAKSEKIHTLLGPAINIKRSPLCGRNFEYLSEDPYLAGEMAAAYVNAVQENGVGTSPKHFAANNQEYRRMSISANISERALREIYLANFEAVVKKAKPWTMMCSYNRINGTYSCENKWLLDDVLRGDWGFEGIVMTDWGAMNRREKALVAGLELEMPASNGENDRVIVQAVKSGLLDESVLDKAVERLLEWVLRCTKNSGEITSPYDKNAHHQLARQLACESAVLLKNENILPLNKTDDIVFIGEFAEQPRYQGGGSSHINSYKVVSATNAVQNMDNVTYVKGFDALGADLDEKLLSEAVNAAGKAKIAVIFAGLPDSFESEGYDRTHLELPAAQNRLIEAVAKIQPNVVVVLHNGSPVTMPWLNNVKGVLEMYLGGQAVGEATVDLLFGDQNPSGRLAETFPLRVEDTPCFFNFPGDEKNVDYNEGVYVGYRYYDTKKMPVLFPFGHGLSYTQFAYSDLVLSNDSMDGDNGSLTAMVTVQNIGKHTGKEVVQLYVAPPEVHRRPIMELKSFAKIELKPDEKKQVTFNLDKRSFAYYETAVHDWYAESGSYRIRVGKSSREILLEANVEIESKPLPFIIDDTTTCGDVWAYAKNTASVDELVSRTMFQQDIENNSFGSNTAAMVHSMLESMPIHSLLSFGSITCEDIRNALCDLKQQNIEDNK